MQTASISKTRLRAGYVVSALPFLFLLFDGVIKLMKIDPVVESFARLGYPVSLALGIGLLELACLAVYAIPRTSVLGAVLLTGFLGGALVWGGLFLREERLRALIPLRG